MRDIVRVKTLRAKIYSRSTHKMQTTQEQSEGQIETYKEIMMIM